MSSSDRKLINVAAMESIATIIRYCDDQDSAGTSHELAGPLTGMTITEDQLEALRKIYQVLQKRINPENSSFSSVTTPSRRDNFNIVNAHPGFQLDLKDDLKSVFDECEELGKDEHWSANGLFTHLQLLQRTVPRKNQAASRLWINALLYRVSTVLSARNESMVMSVEQALLDPAVTLPENYFEVTSETVKWTLISTSRKKVAAEFLTSPHLSTLKNLKASDTPAFFITEAYTWESSIEHQVCRAVAEMATAARSLGKQFIRGALTNGIEWIFLIVDLSNNDKITYLKAAPLPIYVIETYHRRLSREKIATITAILVDWMMHSDEGLRDDEYFSREEINPLDW